MKLINDDCLKVLPTLPDKSVDLILTDPPYGTTQCKWDSIIPFEPMWKELKRIIIHGCLHLVGFNDSTEKEIEQMRCKEEEYLNNFPKDIIL